MLIKILALLIVAVFYIIYLGKMVLQSKKGIKTDQLGKDKEKNKNFYIELFLKIFSYVVVFAQVLSIFLLNSNATLAFNIIALIIGLTADIVFFTAVYTMHDNWRAGISTKDKTQLITNGIYSYSRNPAFLGFDLYYISILIMFFNYPLLIITLITMILFHLQIIEEEKYLSITFKDEYNRYKNRTRRYI